MAKQTNFERRLEKMQELRELFVDQLTTDEVSQELKLPDDPKEQITLLTLMRDLDKSELNRRKLEIEDANADTSRQVAEMTIIALKEARNQDPFRRAPDGSPIPVGNQEKLGDFTFSDGEKLQGTHIETMDQFEERAGEV